MLDMIGILIAFVTVVLLLSVVATTLVQMTSSVVRLRGRNLFRALDRLFQSAGQACGIKEEKMNSKELAEKVCASPALLEIGRSVLSAAVPRWLRGPSRTWIDRKELKEILDGMDENEVPKNLVEKVDELFPRLEDISAKRFGFFMRVISIFWALVIAVVFQVSAPELLRDLSADPALRKAVADSVVNVEKNPDLTAQALDKLAEDHKDLADTLKKLKAERSGKAELIADLRDALKGRDDAPAIVDEYASNLDRLHREEIRRSIGALARIDIEPWRRGTEFYWTQAAGNLDIRWGNISGVLLMAVLLALGAPFWFQMLKNLSGLRDLLSLAAKKGAKGGDSSAAQGQGGT